MGSFGYAYANYLTFKNYIHKTFHEFFGLPKGTFINDVSCFGGIFDLPTYLVLLYNIPFLGLSWTPLPTLIWDVINERSLTEKRYLS